MPTVARALSIPLDGPLPAPLLSLLATYRLLVNEILREALATGSTSLGALSRFARNRAFAHQMTGTHAVVAAGIALALVRGHRRRVRLGMTPRPPYVRRQFLRADDASFHLDPIPQRVRISLRRGVWTSFGIRLSTYHRAVLATPGLRLKQLHITDDRIVLYYERPAPAPYVPRALLGLDTNERSLDGVCVTARATRAVTVPFPDIAVLQQRHADRRRRIARKKSHDRRVGRRLLRREGLRERHRVLDRLHVLTKHLVEVARRHHAALALEDFTKLARMHRRRGQHARWKPGAPRSKTLRRRLSSWPRGELHRQLEYKAAQGGVPILWVDPYRTSVTCPRCGAYGGPRRTGPTFDCPSCGWRLDRQLNAGANVGRIALRETGELGGLQLDLDALAKDAVRPRYPFHGVERARAERTAREGTNSTGRQLRLLSI
ncbi:MAG TPA: zinc ribbon domain-containing protein [Thermoplasmata archaeon]|nr:zinc ribbon domain-containing protein [Thermoplasmata archaeon]